jgi:thiopeptide-type bacteriocin biosynthesis protein
VLRNETRNAIAIFTADSPAAVDILALLRVTPDLDRLTALVVSTDDLLSSCGLDGSQRLNCYTSPGTPRRLGGEDLRAHKTEFRSVLGRTDAVRSLPAGEWLAQILSCRQLLLAPAGKRPPGFVESGELTKPLDSIWQSIIHMHCNPVDGELEQRALGVLERTSRSLKAAPVSTQPSFRARHFGDNRISSNAG